MQELNVWRPLVEHAVEHLVERQARLDRGRRVLAPRHAGTDYRRQHTKTTIIINDLDVEGRRLGYFHNAGYFALEGEDFERTFRIGAPPDPTFMPFFAEMVRMDRVVRRAPGELRAMSRDLLCTHLGGALPTTRSRGSGSGSRATSR